MKRSNFLSVLFVLFSVLLIAQNTFSQELSNSKTPPNIILIVLDDLGWKDVGFMGNEYIETPALDKLANEGLVFTRAYSNAPNCAPSRAAIMSGQYATRTQTYTMIKGDMGDERLHRVQTPANKMHLESDVTTLAEMLKANGYRTAHIGKWNLGSGEKRRPEGQGFDVNIAGDRNGTAHHGHFAPYDLPGLKEAPKGEYLTDRLTNETISFIQNNLDPRLRENDKEKKPFFIHLSHFAPHFPLQAPATLIKKYKKKVQEKQNRTNNPTFSAMIDSVDQGVQKIITALKKSQQLDNTLIIFTSDNGGYAETSYMQPLRGHKSLVYEGGIRVPFFIWWPENIESGKTNTPIIGTDIFPTLMRVAGIKHVNQPLDGKDLSPLFKASKINASKPENNTLNNRALFWYFPAYVAGYSPDAPDNLFRQRPVAVIQKNQWKLIYSLDDSPHELYNLEKDPSEKNNQLNKKPEKTKELTKQLKKWLEDNQAPLPLKANALYQQAYENKLNTSWWRTLRLKLSTTRYGYFFSEKDL